MFVSVIVPMYNAERYLAVCLDALVSQDYPSSDYEILLVDNLSTDRSVEIGQALSAGHASFRAGSGRLFGPQSRYQGRAG